MTAPVASTAEMRDDFTRALHEQLKAGRLQGIALVQGLKALATLAEKEKEQEGVVEDVEPWNVLDHLDALPKAHAKQLLERRISELENELASHKAALKEGKWQ